MISGHGTKPIFFNNKKKRMDVQNIRYPPAPTSYNISFLPYPHLPSKKMLLYVSLLNKNVYEMCAIALASDLTLHIKNTRVVCRTS